MLKAALAKAFKMGDMAHSSGPTPLYKLMRHLKMELEVFRQKFSILFEIFHA